MSDRADELYTRAQELREEAEWKLAALQDYIDDEEHEIDAMNQEAAELEEEAKGLDDEN